MKEIIRCILFLTICSSTTAITAKNFNIIDLGALGFWALGSGNTYNQAADVNNAGQVTGYSSTSFGNGFNHAYVYNNGSMTDLGTLGGNRSAGYAINNLGQVTGSSWRADNSGYTTHAFVTSDGVMRDLGTLGGDRSLGKDINDAGQVTGWSFTEDGSVSAFVTVDGVMTDLGIQSNYSTGNSINNTGQIAGIFKTEEGYSRAFVTENGVMSELGTLGGLFSNVNAINDLGQVVGDSALSDGTIHNFVTIDGVMTDIGYLGYTADINNVGQIVGQFDPGPDLSGRWGAFLYEDGNIFDLCVITDCALSGWSELEVATAINDNGDIVGYGKTIDGQRHGFIVVSAVPIPSAVWLFGSGLIGMIGVTSRKKL